MSKAAVTDRFKFMVIPPEHYQQVLDLEQEHMLRDEPLFKSVEITASGHSEDSDNFCLKGLRQGESIMAMERASGKIAGIIIAIRLKKEDTTKEKMEEEEKSYKDKNFIKIVKVLHAVGAPVDVFELFKVDKVLYLVMFVVVPEFRNSGVGTELLKTVVKQSKSKGITVLKAESSGVYSQKAFRNAGFKVYNEIMYKDYFVDGEVVFPNTGEHPSIQLVLLNLQEQADK